jgi:hypothetical protein
MSRHVTVCKGASDWYKAISLLHNGQDPSNITVRESQLATCELASVWIMELGSFLDGCNRDGEKAYMQNNF